MSLARQVPSYGGWAPVVERDRALSRDEVVEMLWPMADRPEHADQAVYRIVRDGTRVRGYGEPVRLKATRGPGGLMFMLSDVQAYLERLQQVHEAVSRPGGRIDRRLASDREARERGAKAAAALPARPMGRPYPAVTDRRALKRAASAGMDLKLVGQRVDVTA